MTRRLVLKYIYILFIIFSYKIIQPLQLTFRLYAKEYVEEIIKLNDNDSINQGINVEDSYNTFKTYGPIDATHGEKLALRIRGSLRRVGGFVNIEGYCFNLTNSNDNGVWLPDSLEGPKSKQTDSDGKEYNLYVPQYYYLSGESRYVAKMQVPADNNAIQSKSNFFKFQFECKDTNYIVKENTFPFTTEHPAIFFLTQPYGTISSSTGNVSNGQNTQEKSFIFTRSSYATIGTVSYYFANIFGEQNCEQKNIYFYICGEGCSDCSTSNFCTKCLDGYCHDNNDPTCHMISGSSPAVYKENNGYCKDCYSSCQSCDQGGNSTNHKCKSCGTNDFFAEEGSHKNCYHDSCPTDGKFKFNIKDTKKCVDKCDDNESGHYQYYDIENNLYYCYQNCDGLLKLHLPHAQSCVNSCPESHKYISEDGTECVSGCNGKYIAEDGITCTTTCPNKSLPDKTCSPTCTDTYPYEYGDICLQECQDKNIWYFGDEKKCADNCEPPYTIKYSKDGKKLCVDSCSEPDPFYDGNLNTCVHECPNSHPNYVESEKICLNMCPNDKPFQSSAHICLEECPTNEEYYYIDTSDNNRKLCMEKCGLKFILENTKECIDVCNNFEYNDGNDKYCIDSCHDSNLYIVEETNICVSSCPTYAPNLDIEALTCRNNCPRFYIPLNGVCVFDLEFRNEANTSVESKLNRGEIINVLNETILNIIEKNKTIIGSNYILQVYPSNQPFLPKSSISEIDFNKCEELLRQTYKIPEHEKLIICKMDFTDADSEITNQVEYQVYRENGMFLDIKICNSLTIDVYHPIKEEGISLLNESISFYPEIDIFDPQDPFYTDVCFPFEINKSDVMLKDRQEYFFKGMPLCEINCVYDSINYNTNKIKCICETKQHIINKNKTFPVITADFPKQRFGYLNFDVLKCYNQIPKWEHIKSRELIWITTILFICNITSFFICVCKGIKSMKVYFNQLIKTNPPKMKHSNRKIAKKIKNSQDILSSDNFASSVSAYQSKYIETIGDESSQTNLKIDIISKSMLNSNSTELYPYYLAMHLTKRNFCKALCNVIARKVIFFRSFCSPYKNEIKSLNVSIDLMFILLIILFNTMFHFNYYIHNQFVNEDVIEWYISYSKSIIALLCSWIIFKLLRKAFSFQKNFKRIIVDVKDYERICECAHSLLAKLKSTVVMFYILDLLVFAFCWYYVTTFSIVYHQAHNELIKNVVVSFLVYLLFYNMCAFLIAMCKCCGMCYQSNHIYNFGLWLYSII